MDKKIETEKVTLPLTEFAVSAMATPAMLDFRVTQPPNAFIRNELMAELRAWFVAGCPQEVSVGVGVPRSWWSYTLFALSKRVPPRLGEWLLSLVQWEYLRESKTTYGRLCPHISVDKKTHVQFLLARDDLRSE